MLVACSPLEPTRATIPKSSIMLHIKYISILSSSLLSTTFLLGQVGDGTFTFITPMDIPMDLSGNFMEPRSDHFHSGLDIKTQGREGIPVRSISDGWVSRVKISPWGYGHAVYVDHPSGHTSVYGHLQQLKGPLADYVLDGQYQAKDFSVDLYPEKGALRLAQGEVFALSGNSGSSAGPHLHFEIRRTSDQHALDPESLGIKIKDSTPPEVIGVRVIPLNETSRVAPYPLNAKGFATQGATGRYGLKPGNLPQAFGLVGLAIHTLDRYDGSSNRFGVRSIELFVDSAPVFSTQFAELDFDRNRYCNAHVEYALYKDARMEYHRCFKLPNNTLAIYGKEPEQGRIHVEPGRDHHVRFVVTDKHGNRSELTFTLHGATSEVANDWPTTAMEGSLFRYDAGNVLEEDGVRFTMPPLALYDDAYITYERRSGNGRSRSPVHVIHDPLTPVHLHCDLSIEVPDLPEKARSKALVVRLDEKVRPTAAGGTWTDGWVTTRVRSFGAYTVMVDSVPPSISNVDLRSGMQGRKGFTLRITDDLSGIADHKASINGQWILMAYDPKSNSLTHTFDKHTTAPGRKDFKLEVTDDRGNRSTWQMQFER